MDHVFTGGCLCGALRWRASGKPRHRLICHCRSCRKAAGANAVAWATFERSAVTFEGETLRSFESSPETVRTFCARCGSTLSYESAARSGEIDITQGSLDDPDCLGVTGHIWMQDSAVWERNAHRLPQAQGSGPPGCALDETANSSVRTWVSAKVRKGDASAIAGQGVFAREALARGEVVEVKGGHVIERERLRQLSEKLQNSEIGIAPDLHLAALHEDEYDDVMLYLNHSCEPNVGLRGNIVFVTMRDVAAGEELTIDYAMIDDHADEVMTCNCGKPSCRGSISGLDWQRSDLQRRYGDYFSTYLLDKMRAAPRG